MIEMNKDFPKLTKSIEDYIEVMYHLEKVKGSIRVTDIAEKLEVKPSSVVEAVGKISKMKIVSREKYGEIKFTGDGIQIAESIVHKHNALKKFLRALDVEEVTAEKEACAMEHVLSSSTVNKIEKFTEFIETFPDDHLNLKKVVHASKFKK